MNIVLLIAVEYYQYEYLSSLWKLKIKSIYQGWKENIYSKELYPAQQVFVKDSS